MIAVVTFGAVVRFGFVYDDQWTIVHNRALSGSLGPLLAAVARGTAKSAGIPDSTRPSMIVSSFFDRHLFGLRPSLHHLHSLLLYGLAVALAFLLARALVGRTRAAFVAAVVYAVCPLHAEVVAAINYREDLLQAIGVMAALYALLRLRPRASSAIEATWVSIAFGAALFAKESAAVLVVLAPTLAWLTRRDLVAWLRARERALFGLAATLVLWANWRLALLHGGDDVPRASYATLSLRLFATARYVVRATSASLFPFSWSPERAREPAASWMWMVPLLAIVVAVIVLARRRASRPFAIGGALAVLSPLGSSPLVGPYNAFTDRYLFLATLGGALVWGVLVDRLADRIPRRARVFVLIAAIVPVAAVAMQASSAWRDDRALWTCATERAPDSPRAWAGLSRVHRLAGELDDADRTVARAIALDPTYLPARLTQAYAQLARGDVEAARATLEALRWAGGDTLLGYKKAAECARRADAARCVSSM